MREALHLTREQTQELDDVLFQATGQTTADFVREAFPQPGRNRPNIRLEPARRHTDEKLYLSDDWIDSYASGLEEQVIQHVGKHVTK